MVQMNCIDMNAWYSRVDKPHRPDFVLFDLDPPDGGFALAVRVAHLIRGSSTARARVLREDERRRRDPRPRPDRAPGDVRADVRLRGARLASARGRHPGLVTTEWLKRKREGVLVDHRQNAREDDRLGLLGAAEAGRAGLDAASLGRATEDLPPRDFAMRVALERVERHGDLFEPVLSGGQALGRP